MRELADTTVLNNFAQVSRPDLLRLAFPDLVATREVLDELLEGERLGVVPSCDWRWLEIVPLTEEESARAQAFLEHLDPGEATCLAVAQSRGWAVVTDDQAARTEARLRGLQVSGTLGALDRLVQKGHLSIEQANALLATMIAHGYRSPIRTLGSS